MRQTTKRKFLFLAGFTVYFVALYYLWHTPVIYPLKVFVVLLHEISHGLAALATGGVIDRIELSSREGGACYCGGGNAFITLTAGYLGSLFWGLLLLEAARAERISNRLLVLLVGALVVLLTVLYIRNDFGIGFGLIFGAALIFSGFKLPLVVNRVLLTALGLTSCMYAVYDINDDVLKRPEIQSDAAMLADITPLSTEQWGWVWISVAVMVSLLAFVRALRAA